jgi:two-component system sensor histidine kinase CpxA
MRTRFPLLAKVLVWGVLNLLLIALAGWLVVQQQLHFGLDALLSGGAGDRIRSVSSLLAQDLSESGRPEWEAVLKKFDRNYPVHFGLFNAAGKQLAGEPVKLPESLLPLVARAQPKNPEAPPPRRDGPRDGPRDEFEPPGRPPAGPPDQHFGGPPDGPPGEFGDRPPPPPRGPAGHHPPEIIAFTRAGDPAKYWVLVRAPIAPEPHGQPPALVISSDTLSAGGLILDEKPLLWGGAAIVALCVAFWFPFVRNITRSIATIRNATTTIADGRFDVRVKGRRLDELGDLGSAINLMAERLAGLVNGQRRFLGDVAHELCAPLSRLQMALGILEDRAAEADRDRIHDVREEVDHMAGLVNELLSFSKASLSTKKTHTQLVPVQDVIERVIHREASQGAEIKVFCEQGLNAMADPNLLQRALGNLVRNAIRYAAQAGPIRLQAQAHGDLVSISILDRGPGVPESALPQLFDPFFRVDTSRTRATGGVGLGLTIARTCVEACGGKIAAENQPPNGLCVSIWLSRAQALLPEPI